MAGPEQQIPITTKFPFNLIEVMRSPIGRMRDRRVIESANRVLGQKQPISCKEIGVLTYLTVDHRADGSCSVSYEEMNAPDDSDYTHVEVLTDPETGILTSVTARQEYFDYHGYGSGRRFYQTGVRGQENTLGAWEVVKVLEKACKHGSIEEQAVTANS